MTDTQQFFFFFTLKQVVSLIKCSDRFTYYFPFPINMRISLKWLFYIVLFIQSRRCKKEYSNELD